MPQPTRLLLPARSASLPPIHLSSDQGDSSPKDPVDHTSMVKNETGAFPWAHLPKETQQHVLSHALLPPEPESSIVVMGKPSHRAHVQSAAIPIFLAQGNWEAYTTAARILYSEVHLVLFRYPNAAMHFLTSPTTLRLRSSVGKLHIRMDIHHDLCLFDEGWRSTASVPEARVNISTALHSMHTHGRLHDVHFLLDVSEIVHDRVPVSEIMAGQSMSTYYLPMARLQLAYWDDQVWDTPGFHSASTSRPGKEVIAPAFLASRAFQYGFLPLLREGAVGKPSLSLEVVSKAGHSRIEAMDAGRIFSCWLGATILEVLSEPKRLQVTWENWIDPFEISRRMMADDVASVLHQDGADCDGEALLMLIENDSDHTLLDTLERQAHDSATQAFKPRERIGYKSRGDDLLVSSPIRYDSTTTCSVSSDEDMTMSCDAHVQVASVGGEITQFCDNTKVWDRCVESQSDESNVEMQLLSPYLETFSSPAVTGEVMEFVEQLQTGKEDHEALRPCNDDVASSDSLDGGRLSLDAIEYLDRDKPVVIESIGGEKSTFTSLFARTTTETSSSSEASENPYGNEGQASRSTACRTKKVAFRQDTTIIPSVAPKDDDEGNTESEDTPGKSTVANSPSSSRLRSHGVALMRDRDGRSSPESGSNSDSASSSSDDGKDHGNKSKIIANIVNSSMAQGSSSSGKDSDSESSSSDRGKSPCNKSAHIAKVLGSTKTWRGESRSAQAQTKNAASNGIDSEFPRVCPDILPTAKEVMSGQTTAAASPSTITTTAFRPVVSKAPKPPPIQSPAMPVQAVRGQTKTPASTGQKRKAWHDGPEQAKKSRKARRRANKRSRLLARAAGNE